MKYILLSIQFFIISHIFYAQETPKFEFFVGYGFYDGYTIGSEYYFKERHSISLSVGYEGLFTKDKESMSAAFAYNLAIFKESKNKFNKYNWHIESRILAWQLEDEFYIWRALSIIPTIKRRFIIFNKINMSLDVGPSFNIVLYNKRKTFEEVGWPYHVMPNFRILYIF